MPGMDGLDGPKGQLGQKGDDCLFCPNGELVFHNRLVCAFR